MDNRIRNIKSYMNRHKKSNRKKTISIDRTRTIPRFMSIQKKSKNKQSSEQNKQHAIHSIEILMKKRQYQFLQGRIPPHEFIKSTIPRLQLKLRLSERWNEETLTPNLKTLLPISSTKINGPVSYHIHTNGSIIIHNFGDVHDNDKGCSVDQQSISLQEVIHNTIISYSDRIIDIFFEVPFWIYPMVSKSQIEHTFFWKTFAFFIEKGCMTPLYKRQKDCIYPHVRFHNIDIRQHFFLLEHKVTTENMFTMFQTNTDPYGIIAEIKKLLYKQFRNLPTGIASYLTTKLEELHQPRKYDLMAGLLDIYLVARLLRTYTTTKRDSYGNAPVRNAIIYTGNLHTININKMLDELQFTRHISINNDDGNDNYSQCITIPVEINTNGPCLSFNPITIQKQSREYQSVVDRELEDGEI